MATSSLSRTPGSASNRRTFTISAWVKRSNSLNGAANNQIISSGTYSSTQLFQTFFESDDTFYVSDYTSGGSKSFQLITTRKFRDISAYYHVCVAIDTPQATPADRVKIYINGVQETSFSEATYPSQDFDCAFNLNQVHTIGNRNGASFYFKGNMSNIAAVDGAALAPTSFGEVDSTSGIWKFTPPSGITWGTNGFWLKGTNSAALGTDSSGNTNTFAVASGTPTQSISTPSNVYCTFNSLDNIFNDKHVFSQGNTTVNTYSTGSSVSTPILGNVGLTKGKWYWETKWVSHSGSSDYALIGVTSRVRNSDSGYQHLGATANDYAYYAYNGNMMNNTGGSNTGAAYGNAYTVGDIIGVALDLDNNKIYWAKNGTWQDSGNPVTGTGAVSITAVASTPDGVYYPGCVSDYHYAPSYSFSNNMGVGYFGTTAVSSAGTSSTDDDSVWEYDCPTDYYGVSTKNINTYG